MNITNFYNDAKALLRPKAKFSDMMMKVSDDTRNFKSRESFSEL